MRSLDVPGTGESAEVPLEPRLPSQDVAHGRLRPPKTIRIHSANTGAYRRMSLAIESIQRLHDDAVDE